jgi:DNA-directed RNA polymerase specialized sigma24 family protein
MGSWVPAVDAHLEPVDFRRVPRCRREIGRQDFDSLLDWLNPDREEAGRIYEEIRRKLARVFISRGCRCAEEMADETMDRVTEKAARIAADYRGDPRLYFYGVAKNVMKEYRRPRKLPEPPPSADPMGTADQELTCLDECLSRLLPKNREMILQYYSEDRHAKIKKRRELAQRFGIDMNALRIRMHRVRSVLADCTAECVQRRLVRLAMAPR